MEITINAVQPNVLVDGTTLTDDNRAYAHVLFSLYERDVIPISRTINDIIAERIGELKVKERDNEVVVFGKPVTMSSELKCDFPLKQYVDALEKRFLRERRLGGIHSDFGKLFGLAYVIDSCTEEDGNNFDKWRTFQRTLADSEKFFDNFEKNNPSVIVDRTKTHAAMEKAHKELDTKIPDYAVCFNMIYADEQYRTPCFVGSIKMLQLKADKGTAVDETKLHLVEALQKIEGPCLSKDAFDFHSQFWRIFEDAQHLVQSYGDIILNPHDWRKRFFRYDP